VPRSRLFRKSGGRGDGLVRFRVLNSDWATRELSTLFDAGLAIAHLSATAGDTHYFFLDFPACESAMATACFWGFPAFFSALMFAEMVALDEPFLRGII